MFWIAVIVVSLVSVFFSILLILPIGPSVLKPIISFLTSLRVKQFRWFIMGLGFLLFADGVVRANVDEELPYVTQEAKLMAIMSAFSVFSSLMLDHLLRLTGRLFEIQNKLRVLDLDRQNLTKQAQSQGKGYMDALNELEDLKKKE